MFVCTEDGKQNAEHHIKHSIRYICTDADNVAPHCYVHPYTENKYKKGGDSADFDIGDVYAESQKQKGEDDNRKGDEETVGKNVDVKLACKCNNCGDDNNFC